MNPAGKPILYVIPTRVEEIRNTVAGYRATGVALVSYDGTSFGPTSAGNNGGMLYFIPKLSAALDLSASAATDVFLLSILVGGLLAGAVAGMLLYTRWSSRALALVALALLGAIAVKMSDQYLVAPAATAGLMLPFLYLHRRKPRDVWFGLALLLIGIVAGLAQSTRPHAATAVLLAVAIIVLLSRDRPLARRCVVLLPLFIGALAAPLYFKHVVARRDAFLFEVRPEYRPVRVSNAAWHSVYIGFGFMSNPYVPAYRDEVAIARVNALAPDAPYLSPQYLQTLRAEVFRLVRERPAFVVATLFAKLGVLALYLLLFANVGLFAAWRRRNPVPIEAAFWSALAFSSLQGLLVMPWPHYVSGFIAFAMLYGVISVNGLLEASRHDHALEPAAVLQPAGIQ